MKIMRGYQAGVNLGGWISQYGKNGTKDHFDTFVTERDIELIASWGMDHVRLPVDYPLIEDDNNPYVYKKEGINYVMNCIAWCKMKGLNLVLDLHRSPGFSFNTLEKNFLFEDEEMQKRFIGIWIELTRIFKQEKDNVIFELLNEVVEPDSTRWNLLVEKTVKAIREIDSDRKIIIGSNHYNNVHTLNELNILDDPNIIYNFHFYEPLLFTHQKAPWCKEAVAYDRESDYPGELLDLDKVIEKSPGYKFVLDKLEGSRMDKAYLIRLLQPAVEFMNKTGKPLYCGEYGVIAIADMRSRINWHKDFVDIMRELNIGRAVWNYKELDFGIVDINNNIVSPEIVEIVSSK